MKPIKLILSAWGPYPSEEIIDFSDFKEGLFLITGPTGGGKTTIFDGITYALYGNASGNNREKNSFRSDFAKQEADTFVEFWFSHKGNNYRVKRSPRYSRPKRRGTGETLSQEMAELYEDGKEPVTVVNDVNRKLEELMGINYKQFKQIAMIAQGEFLDLLLANSKDRVEIFRNIFQTGEYERIQRKISEYGKQAGGKLLKQKNKMEEITSMIRTNDEQLKELIKEEYLPFDKIIDSLEPLLIIEKEEIGKLEIEINRMEKQIKKLTSKGEIYFSIEKQLEEIEKKRAVLEEELENGLKEKEKLEKNILEIEEEQQRVKKLILNEKNKLQEGKGEKERELLSYELIEVNLEKQKVNLEKKKEQIKFVNKMKTNIIQEEEQKRKLLSCQCDYEEQNKKALKLKSEYENKEEIYKASAIGLAAKYLENGKPCPVCGSLEHPNIAKLTNEIPDEKEIEQCKEKWEAQEKIKNIAYEGAAQQKGKLEVMQKELNQVLEDCKMERGYIDQYFTILCKEEKQEEEKLKELENKEKRKKLLLKEIKDLEEEIINLEENQEKKKEEMNKRKTLLEKGLEIKLLFLEGRKALIKDTEKQNSKLKKDKEACIQKLEKELEGMEICRLKDHIVFFEKEKKTVQKRKEDKKQNFIMNQTAFSSLKEKMKEKEALEKEYGIIKDLEQVTKGNNNARIIFEHYVLASYFETIIQAANLRLNKMTAGRYALSKVEKVLDGRTTDSLNLEVFDAFTGKKRSVKTLSGGESFKAALALALGLSDVVKGYAGGIQIETIFIDEGFGSLDCESLEQAMDTLGGLAEHNCFIGIISHVAELKERIEQKIVVKRGNYGSFIEG